MEKEKTNRIALFFGTFNPIHNGHLMIANYVKNHAGVDKVLFVPSLRSPFKDREDSDELASFKDRYVMIQKAISSLDGFGISTIELEIKGVAYTSEVLRKLESDKDVSFSLIFGGDTLRSLDLFHDAEFIRKHDLYVVPRTESVLSSSADSMMDGFECLEAMEGKECSMDLMLGCPTCSLSSTEIRKECREGNSIEFYVPKEVAGYIARRGLYKKKTE